MVSAERPLPVGEAWRTSRIMLPPALGALSYTDAITGAAIRPVITASASWLFVGQTLSVLPVALLVSEV